MSTERTDQYPEVGGEDAGLVPPQDAKADWPKKIRTLTASELDRLTIDGLGRFYWDGKLVNYDAHPSRIESKPVDLDQHAMDLLGARIVRPARGAVRRSHGCHRNAARARSRGSRGADGNTVRPTRAEHCRRFGGCRHFSRCANPTCRGAAA